MNCPKCRKAIEMERISFRDECPSCGINLHACVWCSFFDEGKANRCREPQAEYVHDRERSNVCEYFRFSEGGGKSGSGKDEAQKLWDQLFKKS